MADADIATVLSHSRLFHGMPPASLADLISRCKVERIPPDGRNFEGRLLRADELRVILEGDLHVPDEDTALGRGNFIGETALMDLALVESIRAHSQNGCTCLVITRPVLNAWMERHPILIGALYQHLSQELFNRHLRRAA